MEIANDYDAVKELLAHVQTGKEYELAAGAHAAIIRKKDGVIQYLELQGEAAENGFFELNESVLKNRFGCKKRREPITSFLIDIDTLAKNREFIELMEYVNTAENKQKKGAGGGLK